MSCLSRLSPGESGKRCKYKQPHEDVSVVSNSRFHNTCRVCRQSTGVNSNCCKLCKSVGDLSCSKNVFAKGNRALLEIIMVVTGLDDSFVTFVYLLFASNLFLKRTSRSSSVIYHMFRLCGFFWL